MSHGKSTVFGLEAGAMPGLGLGAYRRMFDPLIAPPAANLPNECLADIATALIRIDDGEAIDHHDPVDENSADVPAAYTYFGQFIDHDLTLDPTPLSVDTGSVIDALQDFRTPALDLDSVYGRGPDDQPYMYDDLGHLLLKQAAIGNGNATIGSQHDLLRIADRSAVIGDKRNDENKIVSQIHSAIISLHNKIVGDDALLRKAGARLDVNNTWSVVQAGESRFRTASRLTRWHYQWVIVNDYLNRVCEQGIVAEVLNIGGIPRLLHYAAKPFEFPYMPLEFAGAAFRFGHSMVRPSYALNINIGTNVDRDGTAEDQPLKPRIPTFRSGDPDPTHSLNGFPGTLADGWGIDWGYFIDGIPANVPSAAPGKLPFIVPQPSYRIDANLVQPLTNLPEFLREAALPLKNLAFRNLRRGQMLTLPSGESIAGALQITPLPPEILWSAGSSKRNGPTGDGDTDSALADTDARRKKVSDKWLDAGLRGNTPLWYYILREAEYYGVTVDTRLPGVVLGGQHLGPVGSRIVTETIIALLWFDDTSYLHANPPFTPFSEILGPDTDLTLGTLIRYALT